MTETVTSRLSDLETPLRKSAGLAYAVRCFANSGSALATALLDELTDITDEWESIMGAMNLLDRGANPD